MTPREFWRIARTVTFGDAMSAAVLFCAVVLYLSADNIIHAAIAYLGG